MSDRPKLTTESGAPVADNQHSQTAGPDGPTLLQDHHLIEKLARFNRERIPERIVHAVGSGAYGVLEVTSPEVSKWTRMKAFAAVGKKTEMFLRFSTVAASRGGPDVARDPRGFAMKFYTEDGNWDLVGNNTPVFFIKDGITFPDFIHSQKQDPYTNRQEPDNVWDFFSWSPEATHQFTWLFGDRGIPASFRHMDGFGSHTFQWINAKNERFWVKFHFKTLQGHKHWTNGEATEVVGRTRESTQEDLFTAIERGEFPKWKVQVQVMPEMDAEKTSYNPFDLTKVWPHGEYPPIDIGVMELNRNPENYFNEIEQAAFSPSNIVPGISFSPDKMLQARIFSYADAHRYRLGTHYEHLPVNAAKCPVHHYHKDGAMRFFPQMTGNTDAYYEPNSFNGAAEDAKYAEPPLKISGDAERYSHRIGNDDFSQPRALFELFDAGQRQRLYNNLAAAMYGIPQEIADRQIALFTKVHPEYGAGVKAALEHETRSKAAETAQQQKNPAGPVAAE